VVADPSKNNALIAYRNAPDLDPRQFTAMTRLDHNRAIAQLARKTGKHSTDIDGIIIWGNHSSTQYPDVSHTRVAGTPAKELVDQSWLVDTFIPTVQKRGAAIIEARGASSAASAANAAIEHMRDWALGTDGKVVSMGIHSDGSYGITKGLVYSFPVTCANGEYTIVQGLDIDDFSRDLMQKTEQELKEERDGVAALLP